MKGIQKILSRELIGEEIIIISSSNKSLEGVNGEIFDETKNTLKIRTEENKELTLLKNQIKFKLKQNNIMIIIFFMLPSEALRSKKFEKANNPFLKSLNRLAPAKNSI